jgi:hypothetical protein
MRKTLLAIALAGLVLAPSTALGQLYVGGEGGWGDRYDWYVGGRATLDLTPRDIPVAIIGNYNYFWPGDNILYDFDYWEVNINAAFMQRVYGAAAGYAAAYFALGLNISDFSSTREETGAKTSDTRYGLNIIGGTKYKLSRFAPFFEIGFTIDGSEQVKFTGGIDIALGQNF